MLYSMMFIAGGILGMVGVYFVSRTPEPLTTINNEHIFKLISKPFLDLNFRKLLVFQVSWSFALNIATPFYSVYILKSIGLPLSYLIGFNLLTQLSSIASIKMWGRYSDLYSNKTILSICGPVYAFCILSWPLVSLTPASFWVLPSLAIIHVFTGVATAGVNLSLGNIGLKLAPNDQAIVYIVARSMTLAALSAFAPLVGGILADLFENRSLIWDLNLGSFHIHVLRLRHWSFLFIIGSGLALLSLLLLKRVEENGEVHKDQLMYEIRKNFYGSFFLNTLKMLAFRPALIIPFIIRHFRKIM
jgi:MFS family permease